jgi:hypothetical protein
MRDPEVVDSEEHIDIVALTIQEQFHDRESDELIIYPNTRHTRPPTIKWTHTDNKEQIYKTDEDGQVEAVEWALADQETVELTVGYALACGVSVVARSSSFETKAFHNRVVRQGYEYLPTDDDSR